ncbi:hypothetical protein CU098_014025 [Rhizopus stolonifer]|uniref:Uncharacterized protein n=1 Tax=Rhizopus stolonifer TaxID=4846 RepID=A0A367KYN2_RHIST|nr:hypothetical protein CU098_014025 [Rhizopus stolonifer]
MIESKDCNERSLKEQRSSITSNKTQGWFSEKLDMEQQDIVDYNMPKIMIADSTRVRQILTSLVGSAIRFTHQGCIVI